MNHNLEQIKQDYQNIKVPDALKQRVESSISQAKIDSERERIPRGFGGEKSKRAVIFSWFAKGCVGVAAAGLLLTLLVSTSAPIAYAMEQIPVLGTVVRVVTSRVYLSKDKQMEVNVEIPETRIENQDGEVMEEASHALNDTIKAYTDEIIAAYEADVKASGGEGVQAVDLDYEVVTDNDSLFSLQFHQTVTMAGAAQSEKIYHIDKKTGNMITLKDLFAKGADYITPISENIKEQMKTQMEQDDSKSYNLNSDVEEWNFQKISEDVDFYVNQSGKLVIVFDEYEVAPGYMGPVSFEIPSDVISSVVKEGYLAV
jgi:hypothetical protein